LKSKGEIERNRKKQEQQQEQQQQRKEISSICLFRLIDIVDNDDTVVD